MNFYEKIKLIRDKYEQLNNKHKKFIEDQINELLKLQNKVEILKELCLIYNISSDYLLDLNIKGNDCILLDDDLTDEQKEMIKVTVNNLTKGFLKLNKKY